MLPYPMFHDQTKHIEVNCHLVWERMECGVIATPDISIWIQMADMFTKALFKIGLNLLCNKLGCMIYTSQLEGGSYEFVLSQANSNIIIITHIYIKNNVY